MREREGGLPGFERGTEWLRGEGAASDVVLSSRARLARNLAGMPFQTRASEEQREQTLGLCRVAIEGARLGERTMWVDLRETTPLERSVLVERQLASKQLASGKPGKSGSARAVAIGLPDERVSVMVNEEDHLRLQAIRSGLALGEALDEIDRVDDALEEGLEYAFSPRFGYLTCCPTNVGTGARLSVMLHLPGLRLSGDIEKVKRAADDMGLAVRGHHGEGTEASGDLYQLSNQTTLGKSERVLLGELSREIVPRVVDYERHARRTLLEHRKTFVEDQVHRALGTALHARLLSTGEALVVLSTMRLGAVCGLLTAPTQEVVNGLMLLVQPAHLQRVLGRELNQQERRVERATLVRERVSAAMR